MLDLLATEEFDLLTLDTDLGDADGMELCRRIHAHTSVPIIFVASRDTVGDLVAGLRACADDYLVKPFHPGELLARIGAVLRRMDEGTARESVLRMPDFVLYPLQARVTLVRTGQSVELTPHELRLLRFLMRNPGRTLTREALMIKAWGYYDPNSKQLDVYMWRRGQQARDGPAHAALVRDGPWRGLQVPAE